MKRATAIYRTLMYGYPAPFRQEYGDQMSLMFAEQLQDARHARRRRREARLWMQVVWDVVTIAPREHWHVIHQDLRHAARAMAAKPGFACVAILSLALGIGANTAIFSLWNSVRRAPLPAIANPERLVMLTNPNASGLLRGRSIGRTDGPRAWVSYAEFEDLRDHASAFDALMASQSSLSAWQIRIDGGGTEEIRGRLVSGAFFQVLGVRPLLGRLFTTAEDVGVPEYAVISHAYWQRRFGGRFDVIGRTLALYDASLTIVGVTPAGFVGESAGQQPDVWMPLRLQPRVIPGADWLHEQPPDKVMWLHVFGRLRPGVTASHAEAQSNLLLRANLEAFYGAAAAERREEFLDQRLRLSPGARGAVETVELFSSSLAMLLVAVAILLCIACANLANLLLARGAAGQAEIAVRVSLGASRGRLVRQLVTESLALAALGGLAAMVTAHGLHGVVLRMLQAAEPQFFIDFGFTLPVVTFALAATMATALALGLLPAWQMTRSRAGRHLSMNSRGAIGSVRELRSGRWLVGLQLALSLPLLVGAGLLVRTVYNLQHAELGFRTDRLLLAQVALGDLVQNIDRRDRVLRELVARIERIPAVDGATFSQLGLLSDGVSTAMIEVEGGDLTREQEQQSQLDRVGAGYFSTLGIPIRIGRDVAESDRKDSQHVCVINEAFVRRFFNGRNPIGMRVTTIEDNDLRTAYHIVGIVADAHTHALRGDVAPRFFVPAEQRPSRGSERTFMIRARSEPAAPASLATAAAAVREAANGVDATLTVRGIATMEEHIARLTAGERTIARLGAVFGTVALALAAIGLYGVLAYGVTRRSREIAIRIALGAQSRGVVGMILRESLATVIAGLVAGCALAYLGSQLIVNRLYGIAPRDPLTLVLALGALLIVALAAAYLPARRAARVDPMSVLHQE